MKRKVEIKLQGHVSLTGETVTWIFDDGHFQILGKALELMYLTKGDRAAVGIILEARYRKDGSTMKGFVDAALAMYIDITNFTVLSISQYDILKNEGSYKSTSINKDENYDQLAMSGLKIVGTDASLPKLDETPPETTLPDYNMTVEDLMKEIASEGERKATWRALWIEKF